MDKNILICESTPEGIFSAVYYAYEKKLNPKCTFLKLDEIVNYELFAKYMEVDTDFEKAGKVDRTIAKVFSELTYSSLWYALHSQEEERGTAVYRTIARGLTGAYKGELMNCLQDEHIQKLNEMKQNVWYEAHHFMGFVRFRELKQKVLYSEIEPKNHVLPVIAGHFSDRLPKENFIIKDKNRNLYVIHQSGKGYVFHKEAMRSVEIEEGWYSEEEKQIQKLFQIFHSSIAIKERTNLSLQRQLLPLRFRKNMVEEFEQ